MKARCVRVDTINGVTLNTLENSKGTRKEFTCPTTTCKRYMVDEQGVATAETEDVADFTCGREYEVKSF